MMKSAWTFDSQWGLLLLCGITSAVSVILTAWLKLRAAVQGLLFAGVYSVLVLVLRFGLRSYLDSSWLVWIILASAIYVPLYAGYCVLKQRTKRHLQG